MTDVRHKLTNDRQNRAALCVDLRMTEKQPRRIEWRRLRASGSGIRRMGHIAVTSNQIILLQLRVLSVSVVSPSKLSPRTHRR